MKLFINYFLSLTILLFGIFSTGCSKDDGKDEINPDNGFPAEVNNMIPDDVFTTLDSLNMPVFKGDNPPEIAGNYIVSPNVLINTTNEGDIVGDKYTDYFLYFQNPEDGAASFKTSTSNPVDQMTGNGDESYVIGEGSAFTVFTILETTNDLANDSFTTVEVYSGSISNNGIKDLYNASIMLDDRGDPNEHYMEIGKGRVFMDGDGISIGI